MTEPQILYAGLSFGEGPRWHEDRLWVSDFHTHRVLAIDEAGGAETIVEVPNRPSGLGWLPDGRLLVVSMTDRKLMRLDPDGAHGARGPRWHRDRRLQRHGRRSRRARRTWGTSGTTSPAARSCATATLALVTPDGVVSAAADDLEFPNGTVITPDRLDARRGRDVRAAAHRVRHRRRRVSLEPPGLGRPRQRHTRRHLPRRGRGHLGRRPARTHNACVCVEGGEVTDRIATEQGCFACMLGGRDRQHAPPDHGPAHGRRCRARGGAARPCRDRAGGRPGRGLAVSTYAARDGRNRREARHRHRRHRHQGRSGRHRRRAS